MAIFGPNGERLDKTEFECNGFTFDSVALGENPALMLMCVICMDPTPIQEEFLSKAEVTFTDSKGKQIFPKVIKEIEATS